MKAGQEVYLLRPRFRESEPMELETRKVGKVGIKYFYVEGLDRIKFPLEGPYFNIGDFAYRYRVYESQEEYWYEQELKEKWGKIRQFVYNAYNPPISLGQARQILEIIENKEENNIQTDKRKSL